MTVQLHLSSQGVYGRMNLSILYAGYTVERLAVRHLFLCAFPPSSQRGVNIHLACSLSSMQLEAFPPFVSMRCQYSSGMFPERHAVGSATLQASANVYAVQYDGCGYECVVSCSVDMGQGEASSSWTICTCRYWELLCFHH